MISFRHICSFRVLAYFNMIVVFIGITIYYGHTVIKSAAHQLTQQCKYETETLCPDCFPEPVNCNFFTDYVTFDGFDLINQAIDKFNQHTVRIGLLDGDWRVAVKNINRFAVIQELRKSVCQKLNRTLDDCHLRDNEEIHQILRQRVLDKSLVEGAIICPPGDEAALARFVQEFDQPELLTLLLMATNSQPLMLKLLYQHPDNQTVPTLIFQGGFILVESNGGDALTIFYQSPLILRLRIASALINAIFTFDSGIDQFRFYLTDMTPDNIAVKILPNKEIRVFFVDLNNAIILDGLSKRLDPNKTTIQHSRIDCNGCFSYVQEDICTHHYHDINLFAVCQLLLEDLSGNTRKGFLHNTEFTTEFLLLSRLLHHCVYCKPPGCGDRKIILEQIQNVIYTILNKP